VNSCDREYVEAFEGLSPEQRSELKAAGIDGPQLMSYSTLRPECTTELAVMPVDPFESPVDEDRIYDVVRRLIGELLGQSNPGLAIECLSIVTGISYLGGSMKEVARRHGVTKAAVSKRCVELAEAIGLDPSRAMRSKQARESYAKRARDQHQKFEH
jgi:hypothetical protein